MELSSFYYDSTPVREIIINEERITLWFNPPINFSCAGYGHIAPITNAGRIACMFYAAIGIPLCLIVLSDVGGLLSSALKFSMRGVKRTFYKCR